MVELVVLMRGINVGGHRKIPMADLRALCTDLGLGNPQSYIQSGNLLINSPEPPDKTAGKLSAAVADKFGFEVPLIVRTAAKWKGYVDANPFAGDADISERTLHLLLSEKGPPASAVDLLGERAQGGERVRIAGDALWIDYANGAGRSKLTPAAIDKAFGAPATARNLRTICTLQTMIEERRA